MKNFDKYSKQYFLPPERCTEWTKRDAVDRAPVWCSVDLRDGNQALVRPMSLATKTEFFKFLVGLGFKEIEVGFPAASQTEYDFLRALAEGGMVPDDVTVQVLTQAREHIIRRTFDAVRGLKNVIVHVYNSTSVAQREQVFAKDKNGIKKIAEDGARLLKRLAAERGEGYRFEYSPESFTGTEPEYALEVINTVLDVWQPSECRKAIINLPSTVEHSMPHVYAMQVEYIRRHMLFGKSTVLSLHPHNDRGCAVAAGEMGLLAGAERLEGTLFGNGERTGNADIVTLAMNMYSQGVDPMLDFSDMPAVCEKYTRFTGMSVDPRRPYAGELVFAAFSGSHQDAIAKGTAYRKTRGGIWNVPYLPVDPGDVGRKYDADVIRINSQSGKGGVGYVLSNSYGINLPAAMREDFGYRVKSVSDRADRELSPSDVYAVYESAYLKTGGFSAPDCRFFTDGGVTVEAVLQVDGKKHTVRAVGNGRLDAFSNVLKSFFGIDYTLTVYEERALSSGSGAEALSFVGIVSDAGAFWGAGVDDDIVNSSCKALVACVNKGLTYAPK